jgi:hypothetical protein
MTEVELRSLDQKMNELQNRLGKILDRVTKIETILAMRADFDIRLRELELDAAHLKGRAAIAGGLVGLGSSLVVSVAAALIIWQIKG